MPNVLLWSMLGKSRLQMDKECAPGNRGGTQGKEWPLPCPGPPQQGLGLLLQGLGAQCFHFFHRTWGLQNSCNQCHRFWSKALSSYTGEGKARGRGKAESGPETPKSPAELGRGNAPWAQTACPPLALTRQDVCQVSSCLSFPPRSAAVGAQGLSKQLSSTENFRPPSLPCDQVHRIRGRDSPYLPPPYPQAQPTWSCSLGAVSAPPLVEASIHHHPRCWRSRVEHPRAPADPGNCLSPPHPVPAPMPGPGRLQHPPERCVQAWAGAGQGWGDPSHELGVQGAPSPAVLSSLPPCTKQSPPEGTQTLPSVSCARHSAPRTAHPQLPECPHPAQGPQGAQHAPILPEPGCSNTSHAG